VLNKTSAYSGLVVVTAAGALLTSSPAYALDSLARGSWSSHHHRSHHRNHNWNGHVHHGRIFIRIYIYNKNNNRAIALAKPEHRRRHDVDPVIIGRRHNSSPTVEEARRTPARDTAATDVTPASTTPVDNTPPSSAPADQGTTGSAPSTAGAPAAGGTTPTLDEAATGNVSP
jgi:hypothetical protein